jgi:uncharacterized protein YqeY
MSMKEQLQSDLTAAIRQRDELVMGTLRLALAAVTTEEVSGREARELTDDDVMRVLAREAKKRREAAEAFEAGGRAEQAARERAEGEVLARYLPQPLSDSELSAIVTGVIAELGASSMADMGRVMKAATAKVAGRADGSKVSSEVRAQLG